jgi:hypothetical protein
MEEKDRISKVNLSKDRQRSFQEERVGYVNMVLTFHSQQDQHHLSSQQLAPLAVSEGTT